MASHMPVFDSLLQNPEFRDAKIINGSTSTLWSLLSNLLSDPTFSRIYCVIDAVEECENHQDVFLSQLKRIFKRTKDKRQNQPILKLLLTSRPTSDISHELAAFDTIKLETKNEDLQYFVHDEVAGLPEVFSKPMREEAIKQLLQGAEQTFLWVSIVVGELKRLRFPSIATVRQVIAKFPKALDQLYSKIVNEIFLDPEDIHIQILLWVVYARESLTLDQLQTAIAMKIECKTLGDMEQHLIVLSEETIYDHLGVIVKLVYNRVHLIHQSAKDFLLKETKLAGASVCRGKTPETHLGRICLT